MPSPTLSRILWGGSGTSGTFNPSDKSSGVTLSNGNLTMASTVGGWEPVRSTTSRTTGKWWVEWDDTAQGANWIVGIATSALTMSNSNFIGFNASSYGCYDQNGSVYNNNTTTGVTSVWPAVGVKKMCAVDLNAGKIWWLNNAGLWNGSATDNPGSGVGGQSIPVGTTYFIGAASNATGQTLTMNFGASPASNPIPSSFRPWG